MSKNNFREDINGIKGWAIVAVLLFHFGLLRSGYLGVDVFFVINGYLIIPKIIRDISDGSFSYFSFMKKRIMRLFPLVLIVCALSLVLGSIFMLPFEFERTGRSVVSCCLLSENLRCAFTFGNYWEILNDYSPLFHLWYIGILFEFYLIYPIFIKLICMSLKNEEDKYKYSYYLTFVLFVISLIIYLLPIVDSSLKFYLLPFRFFEIAIGGIVAIISKRYPFRELSNKKMQILLSVLLIGVVYISILTIFKDGIGHRVNPISSYDIGRSIDGMVVSPVILLCLTVLLTSLLIIKKSNNLLFCNVIVAYFGERSYSLFIWHQFVLAYYRNIISDEISITSFCVYFVLTIVISELSYSFIERKAFISLKSLAISSLFAILIIVSGVYVYVNGGVVKDVPELEIKKGEGFVGVAVAYVDEPTKLYDKPFPKNNKKNVFIVGNSFARDFCNILLESKYADSLNISTQFADFPKEIVKNADFIFTTLKKESIPDSVKRILKPHCKIYGIGTKNFGNCNNQFYAKRWNDEYFASVAVLPWEYRRANEIAKEHWNDNYIDLISPAMVDSVHVRVFTPEHKYISQDCRHLTRAGAKWYAKNLRLDRLFNCVEVKKVDFSRIQK